MEQANAVKECEPGSRAVTLMNGWAHLSVASWWRTRLDRSSLRWRISLRTVRRPGVGGACRSEGLVVGEHVPDRLGESAGEVDLGDLGAALLADAAFVC
jgi:hypothetical protein